MSSTESSTKPVFGEAEACKFDAPKLHQEVTQLVSQRFQLTVAAIVLFSAVCGWVTSRVSARTVEATNLASASCILLVIVLGVVYLYFDMLLGMMRIFTTYITLKYASQWEQDWKEYRFDPNSKMYLGYSKAGRWVFMVLGALSLIYPHSLVLLSPLPACTQPPQISHVPLAWVSLLATIVYLFFVWVTIAGRHFIHNETKIESDWKRVLAKRKTQQTNSGD